MDFSNVFVVDQVAGGLLVQISLLATLSAPKSIAIIFMGGTFDSNCSKGTDTTLTAHIPLTKHKTPSSINLL